MSEFHEMNQAHIAIEKVHISSDLDIKSFQQIYYRSEWRIMPTDLTSELPYIKNLLQSVLKGFFLIITHKNFNLKKTECYRETQ